MAPIWPVKKQNKSSHKLTPKQVKRRRQLYQLVFLLGCLLTLILGPSFFHWTTLSVKEHRLSKELSELSTQMEVLNEEKNRLESDPAYVEGLVRSTFKYGKPGEYVVQLNLDEVYGSTH